MKKIEAFWHWFELNEKQLYCLETLTKTQKNNILNNLLVNLHIYCNKLYFEIEGTPESLVREFIVTAEGNQEYFGEVENLIKNAPNLEHWNFIALKPPQSDNFTIAYEGIELNTEDMWFLPLQNDKHPNQIGIQIGLQKFNFLKDKEFFQSTIFKIIDTVVGEKTFIQDIDYIGIGELPESPDNNGFIELNELSKYLVWKKNNLQQSQI